MGSTPSDGIHSPREVLRRADIARLRVVGATMQGVHRPG